MLEAYEAYSDYNGMAELTQSLVQQATIAVHGSTVAVHADGTEFDLGGTWQSITLYGALSERTRRGGDRARRRCPSWSRWPRQVGVPVAPHYGPGKLAEELFDELVVSTRWSRRPSSGISRRKPRRSPGIIARCPV